MTPGNRRGTNMKLIFAITSMKCGEIIKMDPVRLWSWAVIRFKFTMDLKNSCFLQPSLKYKKGNAKKDYIGIKISSQGFEKQGICGTDYSGYINMPAQDTQSCKNCIFTHEHPFLLILKVNVTVTDLTPKPLSVNKWLYNDSAFMDFELKANDGSVAIHKAILVTHSSVFRAMLKHNTWKETTENSMIIEGFTKQTLQYLKDFMYLRTLPDEIIHLQSLLSLAEMYMINNLKFRCINKIVDLVNPENFDYIIEFASRSNVPDLIKSLVITMPDEIVEGIMMKTRYLGKT